MNQVRAELLNDSSTSSFHSSPAICMSCIKIFSRIVNGDNRPAGLNKVAIFFKLLRFVYFMSSFDAFSLNMTNHHTPRILSNGRLSLTKSISDFLPGCEISCSTLNELDQHFLGCIPAFANKVKTSLCNATPYSSSTESMESFI